MSELIHEIAQLIEASSGFVIGTSGHEALTTFVSQRVERGGFAGMESYVDYLRRHPDSEEWRHLLSKITIKESYLFRAHAQLDALVDTILGEITDRRHDRRLRVWCAGCARGEEAATLAIVLADHPTVGTWRWSVLATDVDEAALADARKGIYGPRAVGRVPAATLARHFVHHDDRYELTPALRSRIEYRRLNLVEQPLDLAGEQFDVIFLRNVLIYFRPELQRRVVESVEEKLTPEGVLFLGPSESLLHLDTRLQARDLGDCFCYRRPRTPGDAGGPLVIHDRSAEPSPAPSAGAVLTSRIALEAVDPAPAFDVRLEVIVEALTIGENRRAVAGLAALRHDHPESAAVRALEGIARERLEEPERAIHAYRAALYLAPEMDEVRFLLARALEMLGRWRAATREYRTALSGLRPATGFMPSILERLALPDHHRMRHICLKKLNIK